LSPGEFIRATSKLDRTTTDYKLPINYPATLDLPKGYTMPKDDGVKLSYMGQILK
jgi:hypothetical protein